LKKILKSIGLKLFWEKNPSENAVATNEREARITIDFLSLALLPELRRIPDVLADSD
jgi:hypothetical protein